MELRRCSNDVHFIQAIKGGLVTKELNVTRGRPSLSFREMTEIYGNVKAECAPAGVVEKRVVKAEPDASVCNANDNRSCDLDDDGFENITLKQFQESCKTRKRKYSQGIESSKRKVKIEVSSPLEDYGEKQTSPDDSDFMETLSTLRSKLSKHKKIKTTKGIKDSPSTNTQEIITVVDTNEIQSGQEYAPSCKDLVALVEVKSEVPETDCLDHSMNLCNISDNSAACHGSDHYSSIVAKEETEVTLSTLRSKLSKNKKIKKTKGIKDSLSTYTREIIPVVESNEIQSGQEYAPSCTDLVALVEVKSEVPETDCLDHSMNLCSISDNSAACHGPDHYSSIVAKEETEVTHDCYVENDLNYVWEEHADLIPLPMAWASSSDIVVSNTELTIDQSPNFPALEFASEDPIIHQDAHYISPQPEVISLVEDHSSDVYDNHPDDDDTSVTLPNQATRECLDCEDLSHREDTFLSDCSENEVTCDADVQTKTSSTSEHVFNPDGYLVSSSDDSSESKEKQFSSIHDDEAEHKTNSTNEVISLNEHCSSDLPHPKRLLSNRKTMSPPSQERLCKAMQLIDIHDKDFLKCKEKLYFGEQTDKKNGIVEGLNETTRAVSTSSKTFKSGFQPNGILKIPCPSRPAPRLSTECSSVHSSSNSTAIAFSKRQMHQVESLTTRLTKELKAMKDIVDDMLRSEFCLNTSLRYKVNEARIAVKNATRTEETANRWLSTMARNCTRFCKIMKLADDGPAPQDVMPKEREKVAFADEVGGRLCQVRVYEDDQASLLESN
ncbi:hypothetical protein RIF29_30309 [Crotalaria pallida]|uniref:Uncharacterized protein n=1 Tax=Crotalaria pallida TaxID=3830 RepID=A0AAN9HUL5_CROPI